MWAFWLALTHQFHPTFTLALIVSTSLTVAFAAASYVNHYVLVPRFWALGRPIHYACWLATTMAVLTAIALAIIRTSYFVMHGPDADPHGAIKHYLIDFFGMIVHVTLAALIVRATRSWTGAKATA